MAASTGATLTSLTTTVKLRLSLSAGVPLSVTLTVITLVLGPCASVGIQVSTPVFASSCTPVGAETRLKVSVLAGTSASAAVFVTTSVVNSLIVWLGGTIIAGTLFTSVTNTVKDLVS